jgi:hypothetical protein
MIYRSITSRADFERAIELGKTPESKRLEFKGGYGWRGASKGEQALEFCRDVAQFANTDGGVLLIGVAEAEGAYGGKVAGSIKPLEDVDGLKNWLEQAIRNYLTPSTFTRDVVGIETMAGPILAVNVGPSLHVVALWHKQLKAGIEYLYRTDHGKQWMNPDEVERHLMNASRAARLAVLEVMAKADCTQPVELVPPINTLVYRGDGTAPVSLVVAKGLRPILSECGERELTLIIYSNERNQGLRIPYGLVREAWVTIDRRPGLCLGVRLLEREGGVTMDLHEQGLPIFAD